MFSHVLSTTFLALVASAVAVSATPSLSIKVTGEPTVAGVDKLIVKTTITNTADEILTLLNHPESPLNKLPANTFTITHATGITATFTGIKAKYVPAKAIAIGKDAVTALAPGQSIEVEHNRKSIIRISPQEGEYNIVSNNRFYFINAQKEAVPIYATSEAHTVTLTGKLAVRHPTQIKRATYSGCSLSRQNSLVSAVSGAQTYAADALSYLLSHTSSSTRFVTWNSSHRTLTIAHALTPVHMPTFTLTTMAKSTSAAPSGMLHLPAQTPRHSGTLIHESSHFIVNGGTEDYVYGQSDAKSLARSNPDKAVLNADNHEYFAENNPAQN
ncbi:hypothetical protein H2248_012067 [Termitomyces sp. 'cryptogamus']|nr:hypothetical protein H2248_012067 [Termitomyces sp. 'cryptogamus']